jgi:alkylhydroperoxidase family enzyme
MGVECAAEARIPRLTVNQSLAAGEEAGIPEAMAKLSIFRVLLHHPRLAKAVYRLLSSLLFHSKLDMRLRELVIMRIGWVTGSVYEWAQHWDVAKALGVDEADLLAVRDWRTATRFDEAERTVLAATDETLATGTISPETWAACEAHVAGPESLLELAAAIGTWRLISSLLRSLEIPLEEGMDQWPPDGQAPPSPRG